MSMVTGATWRRLADAEIAKVREGKPVFNGCTNHYLRESYGQDRIKHVPGEGWYLLEETPVNDWGWEEQHDQD